MDQWELAVITEEAELMAHCDYLSEVEIRQLEEDINDVRDHIENLQKTLTYLLEKRERLNERAVEIAFGSSYEREIDEDLRGID